MPRKLKEEAQTSDQAPKASGRRAGKYSPELAKEICDRLSDGEPLRQICRDDHMPTWAAVYQWMDRDETLALAIARAREAGQDAIAEDIYRSMHADPERILSEGGGRIDAGYVQLIKARAEIDLKLLAKWNPKRYGDRVAIAGDAANPLKIEAEVHANKLLEALINNVELNKRANDE